MRYIVGVGTTWVTLDVPEGDVRHLVVMTDDRTHVFGADLNSHGEASVGHWPDGEEWVEMGRAQPVPEDGGERHFVGDSCGEQHYFSESRLYVACGRDYMAGTICGEPAGHEIGGCMG